MFSFEWHRGNDIGPMKKKMYLIHITWLLSQWDAHTCVPVGFHGRKTLKSVLRRMRFRAGNEVLAWSSRGLQEWKKPPLVESLVPPVQVEPGGLEDATAPGGESGRKSSHVTGRSAGSTAGLPGNVEPRWLLQTLTSCKSGAPATSSARDRGASASFLPTNIAPHALHQMPDYGA